MQYGVKVKCHNDAFTCLIILKVYPAGFRTNTFKEEEEEDDDEEDEEAPVPVSVV